MWFWRNLIFLVGIEVEVPSIFKAFQKSSEYDARYEQLNENSQMNALLEVIK